LSDTPGLAAALAVQALTLGAATGRELSVAAFCAGLATGIRSQVAWLTVPLLIARGLGTWRLGDFELRTRHQTAEQRDRRIPSPQSLIPAIPAAAFLAGVLLWAIPLVSLAGGPRAYWHALFDEGAEDIGNIQMLWTHRGLRDVADALYYAFVAPWATWPIAIIVLAFIALGIVWLWRRDRRALLLLAVAFGPYLAFDILFQETFT